MRAGKKADNGLYRDSSERLDGHQVLVIFIDWASGLSGFFPETVNVPTFTPLDSAQLK